MRRHEIGRSQGESVFLKTREYTISRNSDCVGALTTNQGPKVKDKPPEPVFWQAFWHGTLPLSPPGMRVYVQDPRPGSTAHHTSMEPLLSPSPPAFGAETCISQVSSDRPQCESPDSKAHKRQQNSGKTACGSSLSRQKELLSIF